MSKVDDLKPVPPQYLNPVWLFFYRMKMRVIRVCLWCWCVPKWYRISRGNGASRRSAFDSAIRGNCELFFGGPERMYREQDKIIKSQKAALKSSRTAVR